MIQVEQVDVDNDNELVKLINEKLKLTSPKLILPPRTGTPPLRTPPPRAPPPPPAVPEDAISNDSTLPQGDMELPEPLLSQVPVERPTDSTNCITINATTPTSSSPSSSSIAHPFGQESPYCHDTTGTDSPTKVADYESKQYQPNSNNHFLSTIINGQYQLLQQLVGNQQQSQHTNSMQQSADTMQRLFQTQQEQLHDSLQQQQQLFQQQFAEQQNLFNKQMQKQYDMLQNHLLHIRNENSISTQDEPTAAVSNHQPEATPPPAPSPGSIAEPILVENSSSSTNKKKKQKKNKAKQQELPQAGQNQPKHPLPPTPHPLQSPEQQPPQEPVLSKPPSASTEAPSAPKITTSDGRTPEHNPTKAQRSSAMVLGDSIVRHVKGGVIYKHGRKRTKVCCYPGAGLEKVGDHAEVELKYMLPETAILHAGSNDIARGVDLEEIVETTAWIGCELENRGVKRIAISAMTPRKGMKEEVPKINKLLKEMCRYYRFDYIDNSNINFKYHMAYDQVHLNYEGVEILELNYIDYLKNLHLEDDG